MKSYPQINVDVQLSDRYVDLVKEEFDIAFRVGELNDSGLIARKLSPYQPIFAASPSYLAEHGIPSTPDDLKDHQCLIYQYVNVNGNDNIWPFTINGKLVHIPIAGAFKSNDASVLAIAAVEGIGITMLSEFMLADLIKQKKLLPILQGYLPPAKKMHLLYTADAQRLPKLSLFIDFVLSSDF